MNWKKIAFGQMGAEKNGSLKKTEKRNWSKFNRSWKKKKKELHVKWKLENNTTSIGQNVMGVGKKKKKTGIVK